jgi:beta-phosphoglucomutase
VPGLYKRQYWLPMKLKGVVFDFNGTLFWDTELHNKAWDLFLEKNDIRLSDPEKNEKIHGRNNHDILNLLFPRKLSVEEINGFIAEKEGTYQALCLRNPMRLAPGAEEFLGFLKNQRIPCAIATASAIENVNFYRNHLNLSCFFDLSKIIFNDGSILSKPDPQIFQRAIHILALKPEETVVFEDSRAGIHAAENAGAGKIIIVDSHGEDYSLWNYQKIKNFAEVDKSIFI